MIGFVDPSSRALIDVDLSPPDDDAVVTVRAWIDTGFTGELVLPQTQIDRLRLQPSGTTSAVLADGSKVAMRTYSCRINWFGEEMQLQVVANNGVFPLLGIGLLWNRDLKISYRSAQVSID
jgi:clan AA aspartic protease